MKFISFIFYLSVTIGLSSNEGNVLSENGIEEIQREHLRYSLMNDPISEYSNSEEEEVKPTFWLFTRDFIDLEKQLDTKPDYFWNIDMIGVRERDTKILIHGWDTSRFSRFSIELKDTFLAEMDVNVIVVDWSALALQDYSTAKDNLAQTAQYLGDFLRYLKEYQGVDLNTVHIIGFGLGAHLAGFAGKALYPLKVNTITALDPVSFLNKRSPKKRLCATDAQYVEAIHTGGRRYLGPSSPLGHADFYPNGGRLQPGCGLDVLATCSGARALDLYRAALEARGPVFVGARCASVLEAVQKRCRSGVHAIMGGKEIRKAYGIYYLETKDKPPYY